MIHSTCGNRKKRAINAESVKEQILAQLVFNSDKKDVVSVLMQLVDDIDNLPTLDMIEGKKVRRTYYPRIMVVDNCFKNAQPIQVGGNRHHQLEIRRGKNHSHISFLDIQGMVGTDYADEGYSFVGVKPFVEYGDETETVPFDEVWVVDESEGEA